MKFKRTVFLTAVVVAMGLLLGTGATQAAEVIFDGNTTTAIGIEGLEVDGLLYNVTFPATTGSELYGPSPNWSFPFTGVDDGEEAVAAVIIALNNSAADTVGTAAPGDFSFYVGFGINQLDTGITATDGSYVNQWIGPSGVEWVSYESTTVYADFTAASEPDPVTIGGTVTGLEGSGLVLQNNGLDDLPITADGTFIFDTPLTPSTVYNVTVLTQPEGQTCSVTNGRGEVPTEDVTDVDVLCVEARAADVSKVAAEGDTLDGTILDEISKSGKVAINSFGRVAFHGQTGPTDAVFTQDGLVAMEGDTLNDSTADRISNLGGVAINLFGQVAFHGREGLRFEAVFTQNGLVAKEQGTLGGTTLDQISESGGVAINLFGQVAFHGKIEVGSGPFNTETLRAVFTQDGPVVQEGDTLDDETRLVEISESAGVAINLFGQVAFHGEVVDPDAGPDAVAAVFTQDGLVAKQGGTLTDDTTIVEEIRESGGVAINDFGRVAFQGRVVDPAAGSDTVAAVFTQDVVVAREGGTLTDGTTLDEISESGGVAINSLGQVAFHGRTGGIRAVFTQDGLVAKEGDTLTDGTTLGEISENGGVAINNLGEVAFHGRIGGIDMVFRSGSESPPSSAEGGLFKSITW